MSIFSGNISNIFTIFCHIFLVWWYRYFEEILQISIYPPLSTSIHRNYEILASMVLIFSSLSIDVNQANNRKIIYGPGMCETFMWGLYQVVLVSFWTLTTHFTCWWFVNVGIVWINLPFKFICIRNDSYHETSEFML